MFLNYLSYLYRAVTRRGKAYECCAACGELPMPVKNRLCVSIKPDWDCDAVLIGIWSQESLRDILAGIAQNMPWLRYVFVPVSVYETGYEYAQAGAAGASSSRVRFLPADIDEAHLHLVEPLTEYFIVMRPNWLPSAPLFQVDFFTPNGIPLLFVDADGQDNNFVQTATGRTKTLSSVFADGCKDQGLPLSAEYANALSNFARAENQGILFRVDWSR